MLIAVQGVGGLGLLVWRRRDLKAPRSAESVLSLDTAMWLAVLLMCAAAVVVCLGTSWPLITRWPIWASLGPLARIHAADGVRVEPIFYNRVGAALVVPTLLLLGITPFLVWGRTDGEQLLKRIMLPWLGAIMGGCLLLWFVLHEAATGYRADTPRVVTVAVGTLGLFAALSNAVLAARLIRSRRIYLGAWVSHVGVGLLLAGTFVTNVYEKTASYAVVEGRGPVRTAFGYSIEYVGWTHEGKPEEEVLKDWRRFDHAVRLRVVPDKGGRARGYEARVAVFKYWNSGQGEWATMTWPDIRKQWHRDIYLAAADDPKLVRPIATVSPGESSTIGIPGLGPTGYEVRYERFYRAGRSGEMAGEMGAEMALSTPEGRKVRIRPGLSFEGGEQRPVHVAIPELGGAVILQDGIRPDTKEVTAAFELPGAPASWVVPIAATNKPAINLVWLGVVLIGAGALFAMYRRAREERAGVAA
jgi:cytochrome c-type biogenesis protein CcmF